MDTGDGIFRVPGCIYDDCTLWVWQDAERNDDFVWNFADSDFLKSGQRFVLPVFFVPSKSLHVVYDLNDKKGVY